MVHLDKDEFDIKDGGSMRVTFGYGSNHDMMIDLFKTPRNAQEVGLNPQHHEKLLGCELVNAYICDDCFVAHAALFEGFKITVTPKVITKVV